MDVFREKRRERRHGDRQFVDRRVQGRISRRLVRGHALAPEARPVQPDVRVRELVDEREQLRHDVVEPIALHLDVDGCLERLQPRDDPAIQDVVDTSGGRGRRPAVNGGIRGEKRVRVVPGQERPAHHVADSRVGEPLLLRAYEAGVDQVQAQCIGAVVFHQLVRWRVVAQALGHLLAVFGKHHAVDDDIAERRLLEQRRREHHQRVEPAAGLVEAFGDVLRREAGLEQVAVLERIVQLRIGHRARFEPAVQDFLDPPVHAVLAVDRERQRVHMLAMQVVDAHAGHLLEFVTRTDAPGIARDIIDPDRQRRAPDAVPGDGPVDGVLDPVAEAAVLDVLRHPPHFVVACPQIVGEIGDAHEPGRHRPIDERRVGAVAVRVAVHDDIALVQAAGVVQVADDVGVGLLDEPVAKVADLFGELAGHGYRAHERFDPGLSQHAVVVLAEGRGLVHQARALVRGDVVVGDDDERAPFGLGLEVVEQRPVAAPHEVGTLDARLDGQRRVFLAIRIEPRLGQVERSSSVGVGDLHVVDVRADAHREVGRQGPRRGGPRCKRGIFVLELKKDGDRRILNVHVVLARFEVGEHGFKRGGHGHHLEALVDQPLVPELLDYPPHRLHVPRVHGLVVVVEIHPAAEPRDGLAPFRHVALDDGAALGVVAGDADLGDRLRRRHAEGAVDLLLDRKPVAVPAEAPFDAVTLHRPVPRHDVLQHRAHKVAVVGQPRGERRAVVEDVGLLVVRVLDRGAEHVVLLPVPEHLVLHRNERERGRAGRRHGSQCLARLNGAQL